MKSNFRLPGPTAVPPEVYAAMQRPMLSHRGAEFASFYKEMLGRLRRIHKTESDVLVWPGSGSSGWEIAVTNFLSPGDDAVAMVAGAFGDRFASLYLLGIIVHRVDLRWGSAVYPETLRSALDEHPHAKAVFLTHNETSTGVTHPIAELAAVARDHGALVWSMRCRRWPDCPSTSTHGVSTISCQDRKRPGCARRAWRSRPSGHVPGMPTKIDLSTSSSGICRAADARCGSRGMTPTTPAPVARSMRSTPPRSLWKRRVERGVCAPRGTG